MMSGQVGEISRAVNGLVDDQYIRDLGASFGSIRGTLLHVYGADRVWLARWRGDSPSVPWPVSDIETPSQLEEGLLGSIKGRNLRFAVGNYLLIEEQQNEALKEYYKERYELD